MKVSVWDTYVPREDGQIMHFDILVPSTVNNAETVFGYGRTYLDNKAFKTGKLTATECRFCHIEEATPEMIYMIKALGYYIIEMENCR